MSNERTFHLLGVPLRSGSLYPGNENDAPAYRDAQLLARLQAAECNAVDEGDVAIPSYLPHHAIPPIRSWPGPRIAWDHIGEHIAPYLREPGHVPMLLGCDCSVVVGTAHALRQAANGDLHVIYIDGDFDDAPPDPARSQSGAAMAVWLLTHSSPFWVGPPLRPSQVTVIGWTVPSKLEQGRVQSISLAELRKSSARAAAQQALAAIPASASILVHFDIDSIQRRELPAAYFPHEEGLSLSECAELLSVILNDSRLRLLEISEYAALKDFDQSSVRKLVDLFAHALQARNK